MAQAAAVVPEEIRLALAAPTRATGQQVPRREAMELQTVAVVVAAAAMTVISLARAAMEAAAP